MQVIRLLAVVAALLLPCSLLAAPASFEKRSYDTGRAGALPYRLFIPENYDRARTYPLVQSMGGYGAWALIAEYPDLFAAAVPICGGGDTAKATRMKNVPVWAFHGELDRAVPVERSREMVAALRRAGGRVRYTEYKGADHVVWNLAFGEAELLPWVFAQRRVIHRPRTATR
jgi:predicted peptidase